MTITPENLVKREVHYCVSSLVHTLAQGYGCTPGRTQGHFDLGELAEQALELASPIDDWEEAAREAGWEVVKDSSGTDYWIFRNRFAVEDSGLCDTPEEAARLCCKHNDIEPYQREVYEHWIVSDWLADRLAEKGEKVDKDFAGMIVWARTTTGQGIAADSVIEKICEEMNAA